MAEQTVPQVLIDAMVKAMRRVDETEGKPLSKADERGYQEDAREQLAAFLQFLPQKQFGYAGVDADGICLPTAARFLASAKQNLAKVEAKLPVKQRLVRILAIEVDMKDDNDDE